MQADRGPLHPTSHIAHRASHILHPTPYTSLPYTSPPTPRLLHTAHLASAQVIFYSASILQAGGIDDPNQGGLLIMGVQVSK